MPATIRIHLKDGDDTLDVEAVGYDMKTAIADAKKGVKEIRKFLGEEAVGES